MTGNVLFRFYFKRVLGVSTAVWAALVLVATAMQINGMGGDLDLPTFGNFASVNAVRVFPIAIGLGSLTAIVTALRQRELILLGASAIGPQVFVKAGLAAVLLLSLAVLGTEALTQNVQEGASWFSSRAKRAEAERTLLMIEKGHVISARIGREATMVLRDLEGRVVDAEYTRFGAYRATAISFAADGTPQGQALTTHAEDDLAGDWREIRPWMVRAALGQVGGAPLVSALEATLAAPTARNRLMLYTAGYRLGFPFLAFLLAAALGVVAGERLLWRIVVLLLAMGWLFGLDRWLVQSALQGVLGPESVLAINLLMGVTVLLTMRVLLRIERV